MEREEYIRTVKASIERHKKMCTELERACENMVSEIWKQAMEIDALALEAEKPLTNGALKKENLTLKEENKQLRQAFADIVNMTRPQPCTKFCDAKITEWIAKLSEETNEVIQEAKKVYALEKADEDGAEYAGCIGDAEVPLAEELTDVITVCVSWLHALGYDEYLRGEVQKRVNEKNKKRGYFGSD